MANKGYTLKDDNNYLVGSKVPCGEFYVYEGSSTIGISAINIYHAIHDGSVAGKLEGFTFDAGRTVDANISAEANSGGQLQVTTSAVHGLTTGDIVVLTNMNNAGHNGATAVTVIDTTNFTCDDIAYVAGAGASAGVVDEPAYLQVGSNSAGTYYVQYNVIGTPTLAVKNYKVETFANASENDNTAGESSPGSATPTTMSGGGFVDLSTGDRIWIGIMNKTDGTDFTLIHCNLRVLRVFV